MISSMGGYRCCHIQFWNMVIMEKEKRYVASISGGKDSMAMVLGLMEKGWPLTHCVYFGYRYGVFMHSEKYRESPTGIGAVWVRTCYSTAGKAFPGRNAPSTDQVPGRIIALWKLLVRWAMPLDDTP